VAGFPRVLDVIDFFQSLSYGILSFIGNALHTLPKEVCPPATRTNSPMIKHHRSRQSQQRQPLDLSESGGFLQAKLLAETPFLLVHRAHPIPHKHSQL
jgi:hypothetical protein